MLEDKLNTAIDLLLTWNCYVTVTHRYFSVYKSAGLLGTVTHTVSLQLKKAHPL